MSFEALLSHVLEEVALDGNYGTTIPQLFTYVKTFYKEHRQRRFRIRDICTPIESEEQLLRKDGVLPDDAYFPIPEFQEEWREEVWKKLCSEKDFLVGKKNEGKSLTLKEVESGALPSETKEAVEGEENAETSKEKGIRASVNPSDKGFQWRVYASLERQWHALAGHGVDPKKIPPKHFELLAEIGRYREKGIIQPELTKATGQDARSVGPRTNDLKKLGYIEKVNVLASKLRTSKLTLKAHASRREARAQEQMRKALAKGSTKEKEREQNAPWTGDTIDVRRMVEAVFSELRKAKNQVLMHSDLKKKLGMDVDKFHFRAFSRVIRRIERTGCLKRIRVPLKLKRATKRRIKGGKEEWTDRCLARCVKFIREPSQEDWDHTLSAVMKRDYHADIDDDEENDNEGGDNEIDNDNMDKEDEQIDEEAVKGLENVDEGMVEEAILLPKWSPDTLLENLIFQVVDAAGIEGISSMDIHMQVTGRFYYRPLDQVLRRLGDKPLISQPPHLLRYAIIREVDIDGRHTHYKYFTYRWHKELVAQGLSDPIPLKGEKGKAKSTLTYSDDAVDDLGFSLVDKERLYKDDGTASLQEIQRKMGVVESERMLKPPLEVLNNPDGTLSVNWLVYRTGVGISKKKKKKTVDDGLPKKRGRPRKPIQNPEDGQPSGRKKRRKIEIDENTGEQIPPPPPPPPKPKGRPRKPDHLLKNPRKEKKPPKPKPVIEGEVEVESAAVRTRAQRAKKGSSEVPSALPDVGGNQQEHAQVHPAPEPEPEPATVASETLVEIDDQSMIDPALRQSIVPPVEPEVGTVATEDASVEACNNGGKTRPRKRAATTTPAKRGRKKTKINAAETSKTPLADQPTESAPAINSDATEPIEVLPEQADLDREKLQSTSTPPLETALRESTVLTTASSKQSAPAADAVVIELTDVLPEPTDLDQEAEQSMSTPQETVVVPVAQASRVSKEVTPISSLTSREPSVINSSEPIEPPSVNSKAELPKTPTKGKERATKAFSFPAGVEATSEDYVPMPSVSVTPQPDGLASPAESFSSTSSSTIALRQNEGSEKDSIGFASPTALRLASLAQKTTKVGRMYRPKPVAGPAPLPRTEPTMELELVDDSVSMSYGSAGGMLNLARQKVILELLEENNGVFPGGLEIKHAFECRYKRMNPKAGQPDRRLMVSLVGALQRQGKINQFVINFRNSKGLLQCKRILADSRLPHDSPLILDMKEKIVAADGNLWFPEGTEVPKEAHRFANSVRGPPIQNLANIEKVEFERMYLPQTTIKREQQRANALARIQGRGRFQRFTEEQKRQAAERLKAKKREAWREEAHNLRPAFQPPPGEASEIRSIWWNDFVHGPGQQIRGRVESFIPTAEYGTRSVIKPVEEMPDHLEFEDFDSYVKRIELWEMRAIHNEGHLPYYRHFTVISYFGPIAEVTGGDFKQETPDFENIVRGHMIVDGQYRPVEIQRLRKKPGPKPKRPMSFMEKMTPAEVVHDVQPPKQRTRRKSIKPKPKRREQAMAQIHGETKDDEEEVLITIPSRQPLVQRKRHDFDKNDDDRLLMAIIIVRTLFGGWDRRIDWVLVSTAFPRYDLNVVKARWPRVRDIHKTHIKKLQTDFEALYLEAYERGELPSVIRGMPDNFNLAWHVDWFSKRLEVPDLKSVPTLPKDWRVLDDIYEVRVDTPSWREEFHSSTLTMQSRRNYNFSHSYEVPLVSRKKRTKEDVQNEFQVDCVKSLIKANILTDVSTYDSKKAFEALKSYPSDIINKAFITLTLDKTLAPKKDANKVQPGRNYEFTDKFHNALKASMDAGMFMQAIAFEKEIDDYFRNYPIERSSAGGGGEEEKEKDIRMKLSPLLKDGNILTILNFLAEKKIKLHAINYISNPAGLVPSYRTRGMEKNLIEFDLEISPMSSYYASRSIPPPPPPQPPNHAPPYFYSWYDINGEFVDGMWRKVLTAVLSVLVQRPGVGIDEIREVCKPGLGRKDVFVVVEWLVGNGFVVEGNGKGMGRRKEKGKGKEKEKEKVGSSSGENNDNNDDGIGIGVGYWVKVGFWEALA